MPAEESKPVNPSTEEETAKAVEELKLEDEGAKDKTSKRDRLKNALSSIASSSKDSAPKSTEDQLPADFIDKLSPEQLANLLTANPALRAALDQKDGKSLQEQLKKLSTADLITGMSKGKNAKDMASYKFWSTQPVTRFDDAAKGKEAKPVTDGPIKVIDKDRVPKEPAPLIEGFEWCEMDLLKDEEMEEVRSLLSGHYVEDGEALFRFNYSAATLTWALMAPEWKKIWHVGVRTASSKKLVAFISAIPLTLKVNDKTLNASEVNFMCVHKKLRAKRLAPVLITEITRRCYVEGVFQAIYTGGVLLPTPIASCRYYHRALNWEKLYSVGFSPMPHGSTKQRQIAKYKLPERPSTTGLRLMEEKDVPQVADLLRRYMQKTKVAQLFNDEETKHWLLDKEKETNAKDRVVWTYVLEKDGKIVDMVSYYSLESSILHATGGNSIVRAAYLFYYATETAFQKDEKAYAERLNTLVKDALILAKQGNFDVFNALTLLDNPLFLQKQLFGPGDGQLHYYLYNYRMNSVPSGVNDANQADEKRMGGIGVVML